MLLILLGVGSAAHAQYDFDKLNDGKPSVTKKTGRGDRQGVGGQP